jgi:hypothetical protein
VQKIVHSHNPATAQYAAWHRRARFQLQREPLCAMCLAEGKVVAARIADHIEPHHNDPSGSGTASCRACARALPREREEVRGEPRL